MNLIVIIILCFLVFFVVIASLTKKEDEVAKKKKVKKPKKVKKSRKSQPVPQVRVEHVPYRPYIGTGPVPAGSLKQTNDEYNYPFMYQNRPNPSYDYFKPYGPNNPQMQGEIKVTTSTGGIGGGIGGGMIGSSNAFAPFPEVQSRWEKIGILTTVNEQNDNVLNLYRRPIAPLQEIFEYSSQDKDGFITPLRYKRYLEDGDIIDSIIGKESKGRWKANIFVNDKWVMF